MTTLPPPGPYAKQRRMASLLLALAVRKVLPSAKLLGGGITETGFFYDVSCRHPVDSEVFRQLEVAMCAIATEEPALQTMEMVPDNAIAFLLHHGQVEVAARIEGSEESVITLVKVGDFVDLFEGEADEPFACGSFSLLEALEGGSDGKSRIYRIVGTAFAYDKELRAFTKRLAVAKERSHKVVGPRLGYFAGGSTAPNGYYFTGPGVRLCGLMKEWAIGRSVVLGALPVMTSPLVPQDCVEEAELFKDASLSDYCEEPIRIGGCDYVLSPSLALRHAVLASGNNFRAVTELGNSIKGVSEHDRRGMLHGPSALSDQTTALCTDDELLGVVGTALEGVVAAGQFLGLPSVFVLRKRPQGAFGTVKEWNQASARLRTAAEQKGITLIVEEEALEPSTAYSGPRIEALVPDVLGTDWVTGSVVIDLALPARLKVGEPGVTRMVSTSYFGSFERAIALALETHDGAFPFAAMPEHVRIYPIGQRMVEAAENLKVTLTQAGYRVAVDQADGPLSGRIFLGEQSHIPYLVTIGERELLKSNYSVRRSNAKKGSNGNVIEGVALDQLLQMLKNEQLVCSCIN